MSIFKYLCEKNNYSEKQLKCIQDSIDKLSEAKTDSNHPGVLLGKIQSGKTRTFVGIIGLAFDRGYDYCIVLTKGTKALASQTFQRLDSEFEEMTQDHRDIVRVYDIMRMPKELTSYVLGKKLIIVVKKQTKNLDRLCELFEKHPSVSEKKILIIDDEADYASVGFKKSSEREDIVNLRTIAEKIDVVRRLTAKTDFLQVTATPQALYLQPDDKCLAASEYYPTRPRFTQLVPIHDQYVGGRIYFEGLHEKKEEVLDWARHLHVEVSEKEIEVLEKRDQRYISNILTTPNLRSFRQAILSFLVAGAIRSLQEQDNLLKPYKCSFIVHTATGKDKHQWQRELAKAVISEIKERLKEGCSDTQNSIRESIDNYRPSLQSAHYSCPENDLILSRIQRALLDGHVAICSINSDKDISTLLDKRGQLQLCSPFNIFVGGQILDRGITIENLLGFFYGRNPKTIQEDTVLQHSRMYGARSFKDMAVTRLYTTRRLYQAMKKMHEFDATLRAALERGQYKNGIVFLEKDPAGEIKPCSPNKILISHTTTLQPHKRYLPIGFKTKSCTELRKIIPKIDSLIESEVKLDSIHGFTTMPLESAISLLKQINDSYELNEHGLWDIGAMIGVLERCCQSAESNTVLCLILKDRNISRLRADQTFSDAPDSGADLKLAKQVAVDLPCIILTRQSGALAEGWRGHPFWWPVIVTPAKTQIAVFAHRTV